MARTRFGPSLVVLVFLLSALAAPCWPQTTAQPAPRDSQAVALAAKSLAALTGGRSIADVTLAGTATRIARLRRRDRHDHAPSARLRQQPRRLRWL